MEAPSILSKPTTNLSWEISDSSSTSTHHQLPTKHLTNDSATSASKFKGVVSQQNGHWGAQIYAKHQRIWLGTFKSEKEAAMAYDSAAIKLRNGDTQRNFPYTDITVHEPNFQSQFSTEAVLTMIKDDSYAAKFSDYLKGRVQERCNLGSLYSTTGIKLRQLFQKELTPSDVSKLNRLVIPKKYAVKYFPPISETDDKNGNVVDDVELVFFDRSMRSWKFRYCYWKSSQSFVFTRGWNRFAKEKGLRPRDRVIFSAAYESGDGSSSEARRLCIIDVVYNEGVPVGSPVEGLGTEIERTDIQPKFRENDGEKKGFKLFGVQII